MAPRDADLNLLIVLDAIAQTQSVTRAAERLGLSKAAMSRALGRLRTALDDPILLRTGKDWILSERARALAARARTVPEEARSLLAPADSFDPATATREFRVHTTDHVVSLLGPAICQALAQTAPPAAVRFLPILPDDVPALRDGVDTAIGVFPRLPPEFRTQGLFSDRFACVVRLGHPRVRGRITLTQYLAEKHLLIAPRGQPGGVVDEALAVRGLGRHVTRYLPYSLVSLELVAHSDCVLTMSERLATAHADRFALQILRPPLPLPSYKIAQVWHPRSDHDRAHRWFRQLVSRAASSLRDSV
jgi:DNA-binding transcriptional LysR family regulator